MELSAPVTSLPGIGPAITRKLIHLDILTIFDLLYHLPFRYEDRTVVSSLSQIQPGETVTVIGKVDFIKNEYSRRGKFLQKGQISGATGTVRVVWFNQSFLVKNIRPGEKIALFGKVDLYQNHTTLVSPEYETASEGPLIHMNRLVPIYPETAGLTSKYLRSKIYHLLSHIPDEIYPSDQIGWKTALQNIHFPKILEETAPAHQRLAFDELFLLQLKSLDRKISWQKTKLSHIFSVPYPQIRRFITSLPFSLTPSQHRAVEEILTDLSTPNPANRLLAGDVGSGKTVVAAIAAYVAHLNNFQTLILAPTQILALQHYQTLSTLFQPFGIEIGLITAGKLKIVNCKLKIIVGTHALLNKSFPNVGLVIIDEQHRFGVLQRSLAAKLGSSPHILTMTATPIPRTLALVLYSDLDLSLLTEKPANRLPVRTWVVPESKRAAAYEWIKIKLDTNQAFIVCPFISESESQASVKAATAEFEKLKSIFPSFKIGLLHGKLKSKEKDAVINRFRAEEYRILVTTPIVEVGLDIPNASIMVIESAERYGLAQLHQLRGRVGRSSSQSYCLLFANEDTQRLKALETHHNGLDLAEIDLKIRGPGQLFGLAQSGRLRFKVATFDDFGLIEKAKSHAQTILPQIDNYPQLRSLIKTDKIDLVQPN